MSREFHDEMALGNARDLLREMVDDGATCPCCRQFAKVYKRKVNSSMARDLIALYRTHSTEFAYLPDVRKRTGSRSNREESKLRYWGLVEEDAVRREDGGHAGWWRVTDLGARWVRLEASIPEYARIYDGRLLGLVGEPVTIRQALGAKFDYAELMAA